MHEGLETKYKSLQYYGLAYCKQCTGLWIAWTLDYPLWTTDFGLWTIDFGLSILKLYFSDFRIHNYIKNTRNTCMQQPLAYIFQTLFQHEVFVTTATLNAGSRCHVMLVMTTR
jgi:hypothetical protein